VKAALVSEPSTGQGTFGTLTLEGGWTCRTVELPWKDNQRGISCIPAGTYQASVVHSPHLNRDVYMLANVPGRQEIEIHNGNFAGDESLGYESQVHGCILVGRTVAVLGGQRGVTSSVVTLADFMRVMAGRPLEITVERA
jgi:Family of unknown function (DUF5675)